MRSAISAANGPVGFFIARIDRRPDELARPRLVDRLEARAHMIALRIFEEDDRPFRRHEEVARRIAQEIAEHVARAGRIALVIGIEQQDRAVIGGLHPGRAASADARRGACTASTADGSVSDSHMPLAGSAADGWRICACEIDIVGFVGIEDDNAHGKPSPEMVIPDARSAPASPLCSFHRQVCG